MAQAVGSVVRPIVIHKKQFGFRVRYLRVSQSYGEGPLCQFTNTTDQTAEIAFPDNLVKDQGGAFVKGVTVEPRSDSDVLTVNQGLRGVFEYRVFMREAGIEAEGGSRPEIEIVP